MHAETEAAPPLTDDGFESLCRIRPLRPIRSDADHARAIEIIDSLLDRRERTPGESDYLAVLGMIVERHESLVYGEPPAGPAGERGE